MFNSTHISKNGRSAAIHFEVDGYSTDGPRLMGRQAAGAGFLKAFSLSETDDSISCLTKTKSAYDAMAEFVKQSGYAGRVRHLLPGAHDDLAEAGILYHPSPVLGEFAWQRFRFGERRYSLCGVTHTTASHAVMSSLADMLISPLRSWDAVICTSRVVRDSVQKIIEEQAAYLRWRLAARQFELPQLPLIPLGIHSGDFCFNEDIRRRARMELGIREADRVALFFGRLSFHGKAHPQAMYLALEQAARQTKQTVHLILCGWYSNEHIESAFLEVQQRLAPSVQIHHLDGRIPMQRTQAWGAADFFISLSDNIQETFGLTPLEAMASELPVIVSDWNGYRETVRHEVDGFRIPTLMPGASNGEDLAARYEAGLDSYDMYCGNVCECVAVDVVSAAKACIALVNDDVLCKTMGRAGRGRASNVFDWKIVIQQYRSLWQELNERRRADPVLGCVPKKRLQRSDRLDPFYSFSTYPSRILKDADVVMKSEHGNVERLLDLKKLQINIFAARILPSDQEFNKILYLIDRDTFISIDKILDKFQKNRHSVVRRGLAWMIKMDAVRIVE